MASRQHTAEGAGLTSVQLASLSDVQSLVELMHEFYAESSFTLDRTWAASSFTDLIAHPSLGGVWLIRVDGHVAGHVVLTVRYTMEFGGLSAYIDDLFVRALYRRRGAATAALDALLDECKRRGCLSLHVEVGHDNVAANALYSRYGLSPATDGRQLLSVALQTNRET
jgi:GNAT superfamily N-acetyltransferase